MEAYIHLVLILIAVIAVVAYIVHLRWFEHHVWPGSSREELDQILKRNHDELVKKERDEDYKFAKNKLRSRGGNERGSARK